MTEQNSKNKSKLILKILGIFSAWLTLPIIGLLLLFITSQSTAVRQAMVTSDNTVDVSLLALNGVLGIILILLLVILTNAVRSKIYFFHLRIGLFIGLGLYSLVMITGIVMNISSSKILNDPSACLTPQQQYVAHGSAIVPIATNLGMGTGFAVNDTTTILTAYHVIDGASSIIASYSTGDVKMTIIDTAPQYDLALLKIHEPTSSFFTLTETYSVSDNVYVYGYPGNSLTAGPPSLSTGIISRVVDLASLRMTAQDAPQGLEVIQTDAAINPGNSGGPLIGACGAVGVVGFVSDTAELHEYTGSVSEQNIGFAVSAKTARLAFPEYLNK